MSRIAAHIRNKFITGAISVIPIAIVLYIVFWVVENTKSIVKPLGVHYALWGVLIAIAGIYFIGVLVTSLFGQMILGWINQLLLKVPGLNLIYRAWRDILVTPPQKAGIYHKPVLVKVFESQWQLGFTNGEPLPSVPDHICVLLPHIPSPFSGRLIIVKREECQFLSMSVEDAMKFHLSTGIFVPEGMKAIEGAKV